MICNQSLIIIGESHGDNRGIIPRTAELIFQKKMSLMKEEERKAFTVKISVLEIYKEKLKDLLITSQNTTTAQSKGGNIRIREHMDGTVWVQGLTEFAVDNELDFMKLLSISLKRRVVGSHNMNNQSSRSHLIFIIHLTMCKATDDGPKASTTIASKIYIIDLAGSEMVS